MQAKTKKFIFLTILLAGCVLTSLFSSRETQKAPAAPLVPQAAQSAGRLAQGKTVRVQVSGAVLESGVYDLPANSRVEEAVNAAGGFTENADVERVNLVRRLRDGMQVKVPVLKAEKTGAGKKTSSKVSSDSASSQGAGGSKGSGAKRNTGSAKSAGAGAKQKAVQSVRINSASVSELETLPGVGPALAQRIVSERSKGRFTSADDLVRVPGIGKAKLEKMRSCLIID